MNKVRIKFPGRCLKKPKFSYAYEKVVNIYIVYELGGSIYLSLWWSHTKNCLFGAVILTKNADIDKYKYSDYEIGFDRRSSISFPSGGFGQNILIFGIDMSSSAHTDNKKKTYQFLEKDQHKD